MIVIRLGLIGALISRYMALTFCATSSSFAECRKAESFRGCLRDSARRTAGRWILRESVKSERLFVCYGTRDENASTTVLSFNAMRTRSAGGVISSLRCATPPKSDDEMSSLFWRVAIETRTLALFLRLRCSCSLVPRGKVAI